MQLICSLRPVRAVRAKKTEVQPGMSFSKEEKIRLANLMKPHPIIYAANRSRVGSKKCWIRIAKKLGRNVKECQMIWKRIKQYYILSRHRKGQRAHYLDNHLKFLDTCQLRTKVHRKSSIKQERGDNVPPQNGTREEVDVDDASLDSIQEQVAEADEDQHVTGDADKFMNSNASEAIMKITRVETEQTSVGEMDRTMTFNSEEDHIDMFFKCMAAQVKSFPKHVINVAKLKVLQTIVELDGGINGQNYKSHQ